MKIACSCQKDNDAKEGLLYYHLGNSPPPQFENRIMALVYVKSITHSTMYKKLQFDSQHWRMVNKFCSMWVQLY